jgi:hypothetical protein
MSELPEMLERNKLEWWAFHKRNPGIYAQFELLTLQAINAGQTHYSANAIAQVIRWQTMLAGDDGLKLNNNHIPAMARYFMTLHPEHLGFFKMRNTPGTCPEYAHNITELGGQ